MIETDKEEGAAVAVTGDQPETYCVSCGAVYGSPAERDALCEDGTCVECGRPVGRSENRVEAPVAPATAGEASPTTEAEAEAELEGEWGENAGTSGPTEVPLSAVVKATEQPRAAPSTQAGGRASGGWDRPPAGREEIGDKLGRTLADGLTVGAKQAAPPTTAGRRASWETGSALDGYGAYGDDGYRSGSLFDDEPGFRGRSSGPSHLPAGGTRDKGKARRMLAGEDFPPLPEDLVRKRNEVAKGVIGIRDKGTGRLAEVEVEPETIKSMAADIVRGAQASADRRNLIIKADFWQELREDLEAEIATAARYWSMAGSVPIRVKGAVGNGDGGGDG